MNYRTADERGLPKIYNFPPVQQEQEQTRSMNVLKRFQHTSNTTHIPEDGVEIQHISTSVSGSVPT